jgi:glycogen synthase
MNGILLVDMSFGSYSQHQSNNLMSCKCKGVEPAVTYKNLGLPPEWYGAVEWVFPTWARTHALDTGQAVNLLKGAVVTADRLLTVSQVLNAT